MKVMGVDTGSTSGVTAENSDGRPEFHTIELKPGYDSDDYGFRYKQYDQRLSDLITLYQPNVLAFEAPLMPRVRKGMTTLLTSEATVRLLFGLAAITELVGSRFGLQVVEVNVATVKSHFVGNGRATKFDVIARCRQLKWEVRNEHEADSAGVWSFAKAMLDPKFSYQTTPMFAGAAQ